MLQREVDEFLAKYDAEGSLGSQRRDRPEIVNESSMGSQLGLVCVGGVEPSREMANAGTGENAAEECFPIDRKSVV